MRLGAVLVLLVACESTTATESAPDAPTALREWVRCSLDGVEPGADTARVEGGVRVSLRRDRAGFVVRGGRCEDSLRVRGAVPACLSGLKDRWVRLLTVAQRNGTDAIDVDMAVRRVGEAYDRAKRECR